MVLAADDAILWRVPSQSFRKQGSSRNTHGMVKLK